MGGVMGTGCGPAEFCAWTVVRQATHTAAKIAAARRNVQPKNERGMKILWHSPGLSTARKVEDVDSNSELRFLNFEPRCRIVRATNGSSQRKTGSAWVSAPTVLNKMFIPCDLSRAMEMRYGFQRSLRGLKVLVQEKKGAGGKPAPRRESAPRDAVKRGSYHKIRNSQLVARCSQLYLLSATPGDGAPKSRRLLAAVRAARAAG